MIDQVSDELRNTAIQTKITRWLNMTIVELATKFIFGHLHAYGTKVTVAGNPDVTLDSDFLWLKGLQIPNDVITVYPIDENSVSQGWPNYRTQQGTITNYYLNGLRLSLWMVPSGIKTLTYPYQKRPSKLVALTDVSDLPEEWHSLITQGATTKGYDYDSNPESIKSKAREKDLLKALGSNVYRRPDDPIVLGGRAYRSRLPRPRFPAHYPRVWR